MRALTLLALLTLALAGCLSPEARQLNALGDQAASQRKYEQAISFYSRSLTIDPDQDKVRQRLEAARILLRQIYVDKIYEIVDGASVPIAEYVGAWRMSAALPSLGVEAARIPGIRLDLSHRFVRAEPALRSATEAHNYYLHLGQMIALVPDSAVSKAMQEVGATLQQEHLKLAEAATRARQMGLALLQTAAAATFAPRETGLWAEVDRRRTTLLQGLSIAVGLRVQGGPSAAENDHLLGGLRRRLPTIFTTASDAPLQLLLRPRRPESAQRQTRDQKSAQCQVGTERLPNPECDALRSRADSAKSSLETARRAVDQAAARCASEPQASSCTSGVQSAQSQLASAQRDYDDLERRHGACPRFIEKPIYKFFFYERFTVSRQVSTSGALTVTRGSEVVSSRPVTGAASAADTFGDGLSCAGIPPDPLQLASLGELQASAEGQMLDGCMSELLTLRRRAAEKQLGGGESKEQRLDALVRARLVDDSYALAKDELQRHLAGAWSSDFNLVERILR